MGADKGSSGNSLSKMRGWVKANPGKAIIGGTIGAGTFIVAAPFVVSALGYGTIGIAAKSTAAGMMSVYGGATPAAGVVATLQSIGATGTILGAGMTTAATGAAGAVTGIASTAVGVAVTKKVTSRKNK